jgi:hypothetical protein
MPASEFDEIEVRLRAIARWCEQACSGECTYLEALDAIPRLTFTVRALLDGMLT